MEKLVFKQPITDSAKLKFLEWNLKDNSQGQPFGTLRCYTHDISSGFVNLDFYSDEYKKELKALDIWEEPEPNYNDWIGEDCVFSDYPIDRNNEVFIGLFTSHKGYRFVSNEQDSWKYCMLKKDYVKLLKENEK